MRYFWWLLLFFFLQSLSLLADVVSTAEKYVGVRESGHNRGYWVEKFQAFVGIPKGSPWCAAFVSWVLEEARVKYPSIRSGLAMAFVTKRSIKAKHVAKGYKQAGRNFLVIWKRGDTWKGHIGIVVNWHKINGETIEGNTGDGNLRDGDGVYRKKRSIIDSQSFRIEYFTPTEL